MRLKELTVSGFRGFRSPQTIPLDADVVVIHGPNGSGKSSIVEALEWMLLGDISRRNRARNPGEFTGDYLRNVHCGQNQPTSVTARVVWENRELVIGREYQSVRRPSRITVDGGQVDELSEVGIPTEWKTKPMLAQGELRGFVEAEQRDRYAEIAYILGLDILGEFRRDLMDLKNDMGKRSIIKEALSHRDAQASDLEDSEELGSLAKVIESSPYDHQAFLGKLYSSVRGATGIRAKSPSQCQGALKEERDRIVRTSPELAKLNGLRIPGHVIPTSELLQGLRGVAEICDRLESIAAQMVDMHRASFLKGGLELVSDSICPFCLQETLTEARKNEIGAQLQAYEEGLNLEEKLHVSLAKLSTRWPALSQDLRDRVEIRTGLKAALDEAIRVLGETPDIAALRGCHDVKLPALQKRVGKLGDEVQTLIRSCRSRLAHQPDLSLAEMTALAEKIRRDTERVCTDVYQNSSKLADLKSRILASTPGMSPAMERKLGIVMALESLVEKSEYIKLAGVYGNMSRKLTHLQSQVEDFERAKMREMLRDLSDEIGRYYDKLNPGEPIKFAGLDIPTPVQRHVRLSGESFGKYLNPVSCFSEAHVNCLGLSLYFCQRVSKSPQWQFFVLDDPIQSMDEQHADRLLDTLREISQDKQLIVLTHQKAFCDLLDDVFEGQSYIKYSCGPYGRDGPQIEPEIGSIERNLQLATAFCGSSRDDRIGKSAGSLRKAMEAVVKELLVSKCGISRTTLRAQRVRLSPRLRQLEDSGFDKDDVVSMRTILHIVDAPHHDDPNWDIQPQRIGRAVEILESVCRKHRIGPYRISGTIVGRVTNYLRDVGVAVVEVQQPFSVGDNLLIEGRTTCVRMGLDSMELDHQKADVAEPPAVVGIKVPDKVRPNDSVYRIS